MGTDTLAVGLGAFALALVVCCAVILWRRRGKVLDASDGVSPQEEALAKAALPGHVIDLADGVDKAEATLASKALRARRKVKHE